MPQFMYSWKIKGESRGVPAASSSSVNCMEFHIMETRGHVKVVLARILSPPRLLPESVI